MRISLVITLLASLFLIGQNSFSQSIPKSNTNTGLSSKSKSKANTSKIEPKVKGRKTVKKSLFKSKGSAKVPQGYKIDNSKPDSKVAGQSSNSMQLVPKDQAKRAASMKRKKVYSHRSVRKR